jgi:energy-coupling factor transport system ATP-binding protein
MHAPATRRGPLRAGELAEAVVLADLTLVTAIAGQLLPAPIGSALLVIAVVPMAVLGARNRLRAVLAGTLAAAGVGFLVLGLPVVQTVLACASIGGVVGYAARRDWGIGRAVGLAFVVLWPAVALLADLFFLAFGKNRQLALDQIENSFSGISRLLRNVNLDGAAAALDDVIDFLVSYWWLTIPLLLLVFILLATVFAYRIAAPTLRRVHSAFPTDGLALDPDRAAETGEIAPLPVRLRTVTYRYPGADHDALHEVTIDVERRELVAIVGPNGSGKSTLARVLAGRPPTAGEVIRPGATGLGAPGGTAVVFQRPELQVLGVRVRDDLAWGLPASAPVDVDGLLRRVGLDSFADRETATLSGGELQRLAVASALARRPALLISDESTAMVDEGGRARLLTLLRSLPAREGIGVVHVTHHRAESAVADRVIALDGGRVVDRPPAPSPPPVPRLDRSSRATPPLLLLRDVGHVYGRGTPWAHRALAGIELRVDRGESLLVVGHNGSGKSTLAWILGGLVVPSEGEAFLESEPLWQVVGQVGVAFQHARLQLLRPTVSAEVMAASGATSPRAWNALREVGFDANVIGRRRVDELSGGQARRVVLAAALAGRPRALVLDEPFAGLDENARADLTAALVRMRADFNLTLICVSHDHDLPAGLVDREIELTDGRITYDGPGRASERDTARGSAS